MTRRDGRGAGDLRPVTIEPGYQDTAYASALVTFGRTKVLCAVSHDDRPPPFLRGTGKGWVTAEYSMLPGSTSDRSPREVTKGRPGGRTQEIQRLIGRSLRAVVNLPALNERTLWVDCDVLQADGGTRCAAITGAWVSLFIACHRLMKDNKLREFPIHDHVAAVSGGIIDDAPCLDLPYEEDVRAGVDMNVVMTGVGNLVEVQGTAEGAPFARDELDTLLDLCATGIEELVQIQKHALGEILTEAAVPPLRRIALGPPTAPLKA